MILKYHWQVPSRIFTLIMERLGQNLAWSCHDHLTSCVSFLNLAGPSKHLGIITPRSLHVHVNNLARSHHDNAKILPRSFMIFHDQKPWQKLAWSQHKILPWCMPRSCHDILLGNNGFWIIHYYINIFIFILQFLKYIFIIYMIYIYILLFFYKGTQIVEVGEQWSLMLLLLEV